MLKQRIRDTASGGGGGGVSKDNNGGVVVRDYRQPDEVVSLVDLLSRAIEVDFVIYIETIYYCLIISIFFSAISNPIQ